MVALVEFELNSCNGAQQHQCLRPDDSDVLDNIKATFNSRNISSAQHVHRQLELICETSSSTSGQQRLHIKHLYIKVAVHRVRLLGFINSILRNFTQFLKLRLLTAEAARLLYLPNLDAASALLTTSVVVSHASVARSQVESRAVESQLTANTADTHFRQQHVKQPRLRGKQGSGACRKSGI